ncbi:MAG: DUF4384 domain-containing protein [Acidiferrobacterales bacterium]|nr:DUF4384 domain-containing protein [Acidiferrobacterales bacterium]
MNSIEKRLKATKISIMVAAALSVGGCAVSAVNEKVEQEIQVVRKGPKELPQKNITDFAEGLRCMDNLFSLFGYAKDEYVVLMEDIKDKTKKVDAGAKDMLISAISDMNRRSQVIKLIAYGADSGNLVSFLSAAEQKGVYASVPPYDIIGSVSQLDKDIVRKQADLSGQAGGTVDGSTVGGGFGLSASNSASVIGLDLSVITTHDIAVIPGVTTRNSAIIYKRGDAKDFDAGISKTGINYSVSNTTGDGIAQTLRALIELSAIELMGKLMKIPYWKCLGLDPEHPEIQREISDWHYQLTQSGIIHTLTKVQLYLRGYYNGPIDEVVDADYQNAVVRFKERLGLPLEPGVDLDFYSAYLNQTPDTVDPSVLAYVKKNKKEYSDKKRKETVESLEIAAAKPKPVAVSDAPIDLTIDSASVKEAYLAGDEVFLTLKSNTNGYVNCYLESSGVFARIFPNRFSPDGYISSKGFVALPDSPAYSVTADTNGEMIHCMLTTKPVTTDLPSALRIADFEALPISSKSEISNAYKKVTEGRYGEATYTIKVQ